jgi:hypothetical protein
VDTSLFPDKEDWGSGDEAMDNKLSVALKKTIAHLSIETISEFYFLGLSLKPRAYNPSFVVTIELVAKALLHLFNPDEFIDHSFRKMKGSYHTKKRISFHFYEKEKIIEELKASKKYRYKNQIDFSLHLQDGLERNPFVRGELKRSTMDLSVKIIFKDFKNFLNEETKPELFDDSLFLGLRGGKSILFIEDFAEVWYHQDQIFSLSLIPV